MRPIKHRVEKRLGNLQVVDRIKEIKVGFLGLVIFVKGLVFGGADASDHFAILDGQEEVGLGVLKEGMLFSIERQVGIDE